MSARCPRPRVIAEAMVALTLADAARALFGGASMEAFCEAARRHRERAAEILGAGHGELPAP
jgi:chorismate synthase